MIILYSICVLAGGITYLVGRRLNTRKRLALALAVAGVLAVASTAAIVLVGDRPSDDSVPVQSQ